MEIKEIGFSEKFDVAVQIAVTVKSIIVTNAQEHAAASVQVDKVRELEKDLEAEYKAHPVIIQAKELQHRKGELAKLLEDACKWR